MICAARSGMTIVGAFVLPMAIVGRIDASATRRLVGCHRRAFGLPSAFRAQQWRAVLECPDYTLARAQRSKRKLDLTRVLDVGLLHDGDYQYQYIPST